MAKAKPKAKAKAKVAKGTKKPAVEKKTRTVKMPKVKKEPVVKMTRNRGRLRYGPEEAVSPPPPLEEEELLDLDDYGDVAFDVLPPVQKVEGELEIDLSKYEEEEEEEEDEFDFEETSVPPRDLPVPDVGARSLAKVEVKEEVGAGRGTEAAGSSAQGLIQEGASPAQASTAMRTDLPPSNLNDSVAPFEGKTANLMEENKLYVNRAYPADGTHPSLMNVVKTFIEVPYEHVRGLRNHPLALALKTSAIMRHKTKTSHLQANQRNIEVMDYDHHLKGALDKAWQQNTILNESLKLKIKECEDLERTLAKERERFTLIWHNEDKRRIITEAEANARTQRYFTDKRFDEIMEAEKAKVEKRAKEIDADRIKLVRENEQLFQAKEAEKNRRIEREKIIEGLKKEVARLNRELKKTRKWEKAVKDPEPDDLVMSDDGQEEKDNVFPPSSNPPPESVNEVGMSSAPASLYVIDVKNDTQIQEFYLQGQPMQTSTVENDLALTDQSEEEEDGSAPALPISIQGYGVKQEPNVDDEKASDCDLNIPGFGETPANEQSTQFVSTVGVKEEAHFSDDQVSEDGLKNQLTFYTGDHQNTQVLTTQELKEEPNVFNSKDWEVCPTDAGDTEDVSSMDDSNDELHFAEQQPAPKSKKTDSEIEDFGIKHRILSPRRIHGSVVEPTVPVEIIKQEILTPPTTEVKEVVLPPLQTSVPVVIPPREIPEPMIVPPRSFSAPVSAPPRLLSAPLAKKADVASASDVKKKITQNFSQIVPVTQGKMCQKAQFLERNNRRNPAKKPKEETTGRLDLSESSSSSESDSDSPKKPMNKVMSKALEGASARGEKKVPDVEAGLYVNTPKPRVSRVSLHSAMSRPSTFPFKKSPIKIFTKPAIKSPVEPAVLPKPSPPKRMASQPVSNKKSIRERISRAAGKAFGNSQSLSQSARARSPPEASDSELSVEARRKPMLDKQKSLEEMAATKKPLSSQSAPSSTVGPITNPPQMQFPFQQPMFPQAYGTQYPPNPYYFGFNPYNPQQQMYGTPSPDKPQGQGGTPSVPNPAQQMPMFPPSPMWGGYPYGYPPFGQGQYGNYPQPGVGPVPNNDGGSQQFGASGGGFSGMPGMMSQYNMPFYQPPPLPTPTIQEDSLLKQGEGVDSDNIETDLEERVKIPEPIKSISSDEEESGGVHQKQFGRKLTSIMKRPKGKSKILLPKTTGVGRKTVAFSGEDWAALKTGTGSMTLRLAKDFLDQLLTVSEKHLRENFKAIVNDLKGPFDQVPDAAIAWKVYDLVFEQKSPKSVAGHTDLERKLLEIVMQLSSFAVFENLPQRLLEYLRSQVIENRSESFGKNEGLERVGRFYGGLVSRMKNDAEVAKIIFEAMYWRPPHAFPLAHGMLRVNSSYYNSGLDFEKYDVKDKAILFTLINPPRFGDASLYRNVKEFLIKSLSIKVPELTFEEFVVRILGEIRGFESSVQLKMGSDVVGMLLIQGGSEWSKNFLSKHLHAMVGDWKAHKVSDGVLAAVLRGIGYFCRDTIEPHDLTKFKDVFANLSQMQDKPEVIDTVLTECSAKVRAKMEQINLEKKKKPDLQWRWIYETCRTAHPQPDRFSKKKKVLKKKSKRAKAKTRPNED